MASKSRQIHASCAMSSALGDCLDMTLESLVFATQQLETSFNRLNRTLLASSRLSMFLHVAPRTFLHPARVQASRRLRTTVGRKKMEQIPRQLLRSIVATCQFPAKNANAFVIFCVSDQMLQTGIEIRNMSALNLSVCALNIFEKRRIRNSWLSTPLPPSLNSGVRKRPLIVKRRH